MSSFWNRLFGRQTGGSIAGNFIQAIVHHYSYGIAGNGDRLKNRGYSSDSSSGDDSPNFI